jgi:Putative auto-transporter adhesin, head GIN domain
MARITAGMLRLLLPLALLAAAPPASERRYMLTNFDTIRVQGPLEVVVTTGASAGARAEGDPRALDQVSVSVSGTTLTVREGVNGWGGYPGAVRTLPRVLVTVPRLTSANVSGSGRLSVDRMAGARLVLSLTGAGALSVAQADGDRVEGTLVGTGALTVGGRANVGRFQASGAGTLDAAGLELGALSMNSQSAGEARFTVNGTAEVIAAGSGLVKVGGKAVCTVRGSGAVDCGDADRR